MEVIQLPSANTQKRLRPYEHKITLGKDVNGNLIRKSFYSTKSKAAAKRKAEKFRAQYELELLCSGEPIVSCPRFDTWAIECLELYKKPFVKGNTYSGTYLAPVQQRLIPRFGRMALDEILPFHVQKYINDLSQTHSPESVKKDFTILSFILQHAVDNGLCKNNPAGKSIRLPKIEPPEKHAYTQEQYSTVYSFAKNHPDGLAIQLMMETGITRSELLGLRWENIDIENQILHINQGLVAYQDLDQEKWVLESDGLKNKYRRRSIPLTDPDLVLRLAQRPRKLTFPASPEGLPHDVYPEFVFHSPKGQPYQPQNWSKRVFNRFMDELHAEYPQIPRLTPHELRHTRATLWLAQGIPDLMVAKLLGHCDLKMLARVYDHTNVETMRETLLNTKKK